jgi:proteic killer suppression protein
MHIDTACPSGRIHEERMARCGMDVRFADDELDRLETDEDFNAGFEVAIVRKFRKTMQLIRAAPDERTFYELKSLHYEKLKGQRGKRRELSVRLTGQWRLVFTIERDEEGRFLNLLEIVDYH